MLTEFIYQLNPFNLWGKEVKVEDLIVNPLQSCETLRLDRWGRCHRIKASFLHSTLFERVIFWLQIHFNKRSHLEAIDKLLTLFYEKLLQDPPQVIEKLQKWNDQLDQLNCLKNDYAFVYLKQGNPIWVDSRLGEIKQYAYSVFEYYHQKRVLEQEENRKKKFNSFKERMEEELENLASSYLDGLKKARLLAIAPYPILQLLFEERIESLQARLQTIQKLQEQVDELEKIHTGTFTIPFIKDYFKQLRTQLLYGLQKINFETKILIAHLVINYRLTPFKDKVKLYLDFIQIDPER